MLLRLTNLPRRGDPEPMLVNTRDMQVVKSVDGATVIDIRGSAYSLWVRESPNQIFEMVSAREEELRMSGAGE